MAGADDAVDATKGFLSRWSRRKLGGEDVSKPAEALAKIEDADLAYEGELAAPAKEVSSDPVQELPPVESLTPASDFQPFMNPKVGEGVRRAALKTLFTDPHFNKMDGLDIYIDDYSLPDPIPDAMMKTLYQAQQHLFTPEERQLAEEKTRAEAEARSSAAQAAVESDVQSALFAQPAQAAGPEEGDKEQPA